jgi:hypothetical protein
VESAAAEDSGSGLGAEEGSAEEALSAGFPEQDTSIAAMKTIDRSTEKVFLTAFIPFLLLFIIFVYVLLYSLYGRRQLLCK